MFFFLSFLLVFPVWMRGGTRLDLMGPMPWMALAAVAALLVRPPLQPAETPLIARMRVWRDFFSDPIFYTGVAFLFLLGLQWWNGPRVELYDPVARAWGFGLPPRPAMALFCVERKEALEMLVWFAPLYAVLLVIRNGLLRTQKLELLKLLAANAGLAAFFGLVQYLTGAPGVYWLTPIKVHYFAAFGYPNHAGAFFALMLALSFGLLLRSLLRKEGPSEVFWLGPVLALAALGAVFSKSRAAILIVSLWAVPGTLYGFRRLRGRRSVQGRAAVLVCLAALLAVSAYVVWVVPGNPVKEEMKGTTVQEVVGRMELGGDVFKQAAWRIWRDHPWFGVGGWGFRHFLPYYAPPMPKRQFPTGSANVHNDPLQVLVEFGVVGAGLLLLTVLILLAPVARKFWRIRAPEAGDSRFWLMKIPPLGAALLAGLLLTLIHSLADLPFRSPAILWTWFTLLACAPVCLDRTRERHSQHPAPPAGDPEE